MDNNKQYQEIVEGVFIHFFHFAVGIFFGKISNNSNGHHNKPHTVGNFNNFALVVVYAKHLSYGTRQIHQFEHK